MVWTRAAEKTDLLDDVVSRVYDPQISAVVQGDPLGIVEGGLVQRTVVGSRLARSGQVSYSAVGPRLNQSNDMIGPVTHIETSTGLIKAQVGWTTKK